MSPTSFGPYFFFKSPPNSYHEVPFSSPVSGLLFFRRFPRLKGSPFFAPSPQHCIFFVGTRYYAAPFSLFGVSQFLLVNPGSPLPQHIGNGSGSPDLLTTVVTPRAGNVASPFPPTLVQGSAPGPVLPLLGRGYLSLGTLLASPLPLKPEISYDFPLNQ